MLIVVNTLAALAAVILLHVLLVTDPRRFPQSTPAARRQMRSDFVHPIRFYRSF